MTSFQVPTHPVPPAVTSYFFEMKKQHPEPHTKHDQFMKSHLPQIVSFTANIGNITIVVDQNSRDTRKAEGKTH